MVLCAKLYDNSQIVSLAFVHCPNEVLVCQSVSFSFVLLARSFGFGYIFECAKLPLSVMLGFSKPVSTAYVEILNKSSDNVVYKAYTYYSMMKTLKIKWYLYKKGIAGRTH